MLAAVLLVAQLLSELNHYRSECGLHSLKLDTRLSAVAVTHANDMVSNDFFAHESRDGRSPFDRMRQAGIRFSFAGENIAMAPSATIASEALFESTPHRENILEPQFKRVGIAVSRRADGELYFVEDFSD